jgi:hypothetical protein
MRCSRKKLHKNENVSIAKSGGNELENRGKKA